MPYKDYLKQKEYYKQYNINRKNQYLKKIEDLNQSDKNTKKVMIPPDETKIIIKKIDPIIQPGDQAILPGDPIIQPGDQAILPGDSIKTEFNPTIQKPDRPIPVRLINFNVLDYESIDYISDFIYNVVEKEYAITKIINDLF